MTHPHSHSTETNMAKAFASQADLEEKKITFTQLSENAYAYTAEGDPNSGVIIGDDGVLIVDTTATPAMAQDLIANIRRVTDKPIKYVVLSHYHAVRVLGASAYFEEGAQQVIASRGTYEMIVERGEQDMKSEIERFPRLFAGVETVPGLTWPTLVFEKEITLWLGKLEVKIAHLGSGHTQCFERRRPLFELSIAAIAGRVIFHEVAREQHLLRRQPHHRIALRVTRAEMRNLHFELAQPQGNFLFEDEGRPSQARHRFDAREKARKTLDLRLHVLLAALDDHLVRTAARDHLLRAFFKIGRCA